MRLNTSLRWRATLLGAAVLTACADGAAPTASPPSLDRVGSGGAPATIRLGYFSRSPVIVVAQKHGYFADEGLTVREFRTPSSPVIFRNLRDRNWDIILTQIDNVFNYRYNQSNPIGGTFEPVAFFGTDWGNGASLVARPEFTTVESLRGKRVAVDSPNSGFAFVLYGIMRAHGLERGTDYTVVTTGGTPFRYADLINGVKAEATILNAGYQFRAAAKGMNVLGQIRDAADPFMGGSGVAHRDWLDANPGVAVRFLRAYIRAQEYTLDPANRGEILAILTADAGGDTNVAEQTYRVLTAAGEGLIPDASIDTKGLFGTGSLRHSFGGFDEEPNLRWLASAASGLYDLSYWRHAQAPRGRANGR